MKYKVLIHRCTDTYRVSKIADEISRLSGHPRDVVQNAITQKNVCIRKETDEVDALQLRRQFESLGAVVEIVPLESIAPVAGMPRQREEYPAGDDDEDDEYGPPGKILNDTELVEVLKSRKDIYQVQKNSNLRNSQIVALILTIVMGYYLSVAKNLVVKSDFIEVPIKEANARMVQGTIDGTLNKDERQKQEEEMKKKEEMPAQSDKKRLMPSKAKGMGGTSGGGGDPRSRVTKMGVLGIISGQVRGKTVASADLFGKGGFAQGIDAILVGVGGLKAGGGGGVGRKGAAGIGYGVGYGSGFGGGTGNIDDLIGSLMGGDDGAVNLKKRGSLTISQPQFTKGGALTGGRSRASIMRVVMQNLNALRYAYNQRLREMPGLKGRITVKFAIDEFGKVIFSEVQSSTMGDPVLEGIVVEKIKRWVFEKIDKPGDVTEVVYPFVFSQ